MLSNKLSLLVVLASTLGLVTAVPSVAIDGKRRLDTRQHGNNYHGSNKHHKASSSSVVASSSKVAATTAAAAATTTSTSSSSGSGSIYSGVATYFLQGGNAGACGIVHADSDLIVAIPNAFWGSDYSTASSYCGSKMVVSAASTGQSVTVTVADVCPTCVGTDSIDLSEGAISALAGSTDYTQEGQYDVTWQWAA